MSLKKPSEYFKKNIITVNDSVEEMQNTPELDTFSDAYNVFKRNLSKVDVLNNFSETLTNYQTNVEKVNYLSEKIGEIDKDIKNFLTKEDLDKALISQLLFLEECIRDVQEKVKGINHKNLTQVKLDISSLSETVNIFIDEEIPRYEKLVVESETRLTDKCEVLEDELKDTLDNIKDVIDEKYISDFKSLNEEIDRIKTDDIPKYKNLIVDSEIKTDSKIKEFAEVFDNTVNDIISKIELVKEDNTEIFDTLNSKVNEVNQIHNLMLDDIEKSENTRDELDKKIVDLEVEILKNESHIEKQNKNIEDIHGDVKSAIKRLNLEELESKNYKLGKKVKYLEEVFEKFNEKEILTENIITEPSSTNNNDSLTPLDKNFVTLDQLQNHYKLFINRIQQQLATFGGGGETRFEFLDDVDRDSAKDNGKFLKYDSSIGKWVGAEVSVEAGSQTLDETLGLGNTSSIGMSVGVTTATKLHVDPVGSGVTYNEDLVVQGNARVTGILSIGTSSIVLDSNAKEIRGVEKIRIEPEEPDLRPIIIKQNAGKIIFAKTEEINGEEVETESESSVGIGSTVSINTTGIITASSFFGDGSGLTGIGGGVVVQNTGSDVGTASTINFGSDLDATFSGGVATINVSIPLSAITDVNTSNLSGIATDYLMVYDPTIPGFKFVNPKTYFGINNDANPAPDIVDYGVY